MSAQHTPGPLTCCPHCGGQAGYTTTIHYKAVKVYNWSGLDVDSDRFEVISETNHRCEDCGKRVGAAIAKAQGGAS